MHTRARSVPNLSVSYADKTTDQNIIAIISTAIFIFKLFEYINITSPAHLIGDITARYTSEMRQAPQ